ncbi:MAG TPA: TetR family transcriptional regulator, partial [Candidatus Omnitrophota bacterium]|nr:TetR family transcriptional regulator [Candidatus Omnitrophota bacterium]
MAKKHSDETDAVVTAAFALAADKGWRRASLVEIADRAGIRLAELVDRFPTKTHILDSYAKTIDRRMMEGKLDADDPMRDRLFDVVMRRFEAMAPDRRALAVILRETGDDPWTLACGARRFWKSMAL